MNYYHEVQYVAVVDKNDTVLDRVERWEAHNKGILHRGFTVGLKYKDAWIVQHRKHPVFDSVLDVSCSSHPPYTSEESTSLKSMAEAVIVTIQREWHVEGQSIVADKLRHEGTVYYKANDPLSKFVEHEICHVYSLELLTIPTIAEEFAYGMSVVPHKLLMSSQNILRAAFAPWVAPMLPLLQH